MSDDFVDVLEAEVRRIVDNAVKRTVKNGRSTAMGRNI